MKLISLLMLSGLGLLSCDRFPELPSDGGGTPPRSSSCGTQSVGNICTVGNTTVVTQTRSVGQFQRVSSQVCGQLVLTQGSPNVRIRTAENLQPLIEAVVVEGELRLRIKENTCITPREDVVIEVSAPTLTNLDLTGGITAKLTGPWSLGESVGVTTVGGIRLAVENPTAVKNLTLKAAGGLQFEGYTLTAETAAVSLTGGGTVQLTASKTLDVSITGGGTVYYKGNPTISRQLVGGGQVINAN